MMYLFDRDKLNKKTKNEKENQCEQSLKSLRQHSTGHGLIIVTKEVTFMRKYIHFFHTHHYDGAAHSV